MEAKRSVPQAKNKAESFDWERVFSTWKPLTELPPELIASEAEQERILSVYNRALDQAVTGNTDIAKIALDKLTASWPQFAEASSLYGVILARERQFREAEEQFEKVLLASPTPHFQKRSTAAASPHAKSAYGKKRAIRGVKKARNCSCLFGPIWPKAESCNAPPTMAA